MKLFQKIKNQTTNNVYDQDSRFIYHIPESHYPMWLPSEVSPRVQCECLFPRWGPILGGYRTFGRWGLVEEGGIKDRTLSVVQVWIPGVMHTASAMLLPWTELLCSAFYEGMKSSETMSQSVLPQLLLVRYCGPSNANVTNTLPFSKLHNCSLDKNNTHQYVTCMLSTLFFEEWS